MGLKHEHEGPEPEGAAQPLKVLWGRLEAPAGVLSRPVDALPVDLFRILAGVLSFSYFMHLYLQARDFSAPDGLVDHLLLREMFWYLAISLYPPFITLPWLQGLFLVCAAGALAIAAGWRVKLMAGLLFVVAVSTYRWNFLVMYVDDAIMHLVLFWLLLLPVGRTLVLGEWLREGKPAWRRWKQMQAPGMAVRCFMGNIALVYLVAGLWKWTSPMWHDGTALHAVLQLPISRAPEFWAQVAHGWWLKLLSHAGLVVETVFPIVFLLRSGHWIRWIMLIGIMGFHIGIIATMKIPFANIACIAAMVLVYREELMSLVRKARATEWLVPPVPGRGDFCGRVAMVLIVLLSLSMLRNVPGLGRKPESWYQTIEQQIDARSAGGLAALHKPVYCILWLGGIAQEYQLFNWIDMRNYQVDYMIREELPDGREVMIEPKQMFPHTTRSVLAQCYMYDIRWMRIPEEHNIALKQSLMTRFAGRYCRLYEPEGLVTVEATVRRVLPGRDEPPPQKHVTLMQFRNSADGPVMLYMEMHGALD